MLFVLGYIVYFLIAHACTLFSLSGGHLQVCVYSSSLCSRDGQSEHSYSDGGPYADLEGATFLWSELSL